MTWFDTRELAQAAAAAPRAKATAVLEGTEAEAQQALAQEQAWQAERKATRKTARQVAVRVAAATEFEFDDEEETPVQTVLRTESEAELASDGPEPPQPDPTPRNASFGRLVHALLAQLPKANSDLETAAKTLAAQYALREEGAKAAADLASKASTIPEIKAAESADLVYRELPFAVPITEAILATERIDLAYRKAGEWTLIDFKTSDLRDPAAAKKAHGAQMEVYTQALAAITGAPVRAALCLLRTGQLLGGA